MRDATSDHYSKIQKASGLKTLLIAGGKNLFNDY